MFTPATTTRQNLGPMFSDGRPMSFTSSTSPIDILLINTNKNLKVKKEHCLFYDKMIYNLADKLIYNSGKRKYYEELFEDEIGNNVSEQLTKDYIANSFEDKKLLYNNDKILDKVSGRGSKFTLFVIPTDIEYAVLTKTEKFQRFKKDVKPHIFDDSLFNTFKSLKNIYFLPCLMGKKKISENEFLSNLREELSKLKDIVDTNFKDAIKANDETDLYKKISFFFNPDGNISLEFYLKSKLYHKASNLEFLKKHLFEEIGNIRSYGQLERNLVVDEKLYIAPFLSSRLEKREYISFLIKNIFKLEILSELKSGDFESFYDKGVIRLDVKFKKKIIKNSYDFDTTQLHKNSTYRFTFLNSDDYIDIVLHDSSEEKSQTYHKIKIKNIPSNVKNKNLERYSSLEENSNNEKLYLKITSSGLLKKAGIYIKNRNVYKEVIRGVLTINDDDSDDDYQDLEPTNLTHKFQSKRLYYIENFNFNMNSLKDFWSSKNEGNISKSQLREFLIETFANKNSLYNYFLFCSEHPKHTKLIYQDFYDDNTVLEINNKARIESIIKKLINELLKKKSNFYVYRKGRSNTKNSQQEKGVKRVKTTYIIKNMKITEPFEKPFKIEITLEKSDESVKPETYENMNMSELFKPSQKKCLTRKKIIKKQAKKMVKNITQKLQYRLRAFM